MSASDLVRLMVPRHEIVADVAHAIALAEIRLNAQRALEEFDRRAVQIIAFHNRSIGQRRRFLRLRGSF